MYVSIHFSNIVKVSMRNSLQYVLASGLRHSTEGVSSSHYETYLGVCHFLMFIKQSIEIPAPFQVLKSSECKALARTVAGNLQDLVKIHVIFADGRDGSDGKILFQSCRN